VDSFIDTSTNAYFYPYGTGSYTDLHAYYRAREAINLESASTGDLSVIVAEITSTNHRPEVVGMGKWKWRSSSPNPNERNTSQLSVTDMNAFSGLTEE